MRQFRHLLVVLLLLATTSCVHVGQRLLTIQIERNGKVLLEGICGVPDNMPVRNMWNVLPHVSFAAKAEDPPPDELNGDIVVRIKHVDRELASAQLKTLSLQPDASRSAWTLGEDEVERIKQVASD